MNTDIRISVSFRNHRKRTKLRMILGDRSTDYLLDLWLSVAMDRPDGDLHGLDAMDIAIMAGWPGEPSVFVQALLDVGFLDSTVVERSLNDVVTTQYSLHDWCEHNGYASAANDRSDKSRFSRMAHTHPQLHAELKEKGQNSISSEDYRRLTTVERPLTNRLSPSPSPSPSPSQESVQVPYDGIMAAYNKFCPDLPHSLDINSERRRLIKDAYMRYIDHPIGVLNVFDKLFKNVQQSSFLKGKSPGHDGKPFKFRINWMFEEKNMSKILEGDYSDPAPIPARKREAVL